MAKQTFNYRPDIEPTLEIKPNVSVTRFGDGYESRTPIGINTSPQKWSLTFTRTGSEATGIIGFLEDRNATEAFYWETPRQQTLSFVCRQFSANKLAGPVWQIKATFEQVFEV